MIRLDRNIRIFKLDFGKNEKDEKITVKQYVNKSDGKADMIRCAFRDLSSKERFQFSQVDEETSCVFEMNRRFITSEYFIEYERKDFGLTTYAVTGTDGYDDYSKTRIKVRAKEVTAPRYDAISWGGKTV